MDERGVVRSGMARFGTTIFAEMTRLAVERRAVNLGQGFPDFAGPQFLKDAACAAVAGDWNQYARSGGVVELVQAVAAKVARCWGLEWDPMDEVTIFSGCTEAIHCAIMALCEAGDEVLMFEPTYDSYHPCVVMAGATPRFVELEAPGFRWDSAKLEAAFSERTRAVLLNSPHNPTGRVLARDELEELAALCRKHDVYVIADEVYDHMVFEGEHVPMASLRGMRERTISLNSTGKTYSMTGWKIGYATAVPELTRALRMVHQFVSFSTATPLQVAMVEAMNAPPSYYERLREMYAERRAKLMVALETAGFELMPQEGTYFVCADFRPFGFEDDVEFVKHMIDRAGVVAIPPSAFFADKRRVPYVRFAFCKTHAVLEEAGRRLQELRP